MSKDERPEIQDYHEDTDIFRVHTAVMREKVNISTRRENPPVWIIVLSSLILIGGGTYLGAYSGGFRNDVSDPFAAAHIADVRQVDGPVVASESDIGRETYANCASCHGPTGKGVPGMFPPLEGTDWVTGGTKRLALIILNGVEGPLVVNGQTYGAQVMQPWNTLTDKQIAGVMTYIRSSWGNDASPVTEKMVANARKEFANIKTKANPAILAEIPADADLTE